MGRFGRGRVDLSVLRATDVIKFVRRAAGQLKGKRVLLMTTALRSFLRFARYRGDITLDLATCVPPVASWSLSTLPKALPPAQVEQVLAHACERSTAVGRRDYAILLLLARLGLRGGEVCHLVLEDIDWENSRIAIRGKGGRVTQLPMPVDVGKAIAAYLQHDRPPVSGNRRLFLGFEHLWPALKIKDLLDRWSSMRCSEPKSIHHERVRISSATRSPRRCCNRAVR